MQSGRYVAADGNCGVYLLLHLWESRKYVWASFVVLLLYWSGILVSREHREEGKNRKKYDGRKGFCGIIATAMIRAEVRIVLPYHDAEHMV